MEDDRRQLMLEDEVATLVITSVLARDSGEYVVSAGEQISTLQLVVQGKRKYRCRCRRFSCHYYCCGLVVVVVVVSIVGVGRERRDLLR